MWIHSHTKTRLYIITCLRNVAFVVGIWIFCCNVRIYYTFHNNVIPHNIMFFREINENIEGKKNKNFEWCNAKCKTTNYDFHLGTHKLYLIIKWAYILILYIVFLGFKIYRFYCSIRSKYNRSIVKPIYLKSNTWRLRNQQFTIRHITL